MFGWLKPGFARTPQQQCRSVRIHPPHLFTRAGTTYQCRGSRKKVV